MKKMRLKKCGKKAFPFQLVQKELELACGSFKAACNGMYPQITP